MDIRIIFHVGFQMEKNIFVAENAQMVVCVGSVAVLLSYHQKERL
jgi:hypothetical protein